MDLKFIELEDLRSIQNKLAKKYTISIKTKGELTRPKDYSFNPAEVSIMNEEVLAEMHSKQEHTTFIYYELPFGVEKELIICLSAIVDSMIRAEKSLKGHNQKVAAAILLGKLITEQEVLASMLDIETIMFINRTEEGLKINQDYEHYKNYYRTKPFKAIKICLQLNNPSIYLSVEHVNHEESTGEGPCSYHLNSKVISTPKNPLNNHIDYLKYTPIRVKSLKEEEIAHKKAVEAFMKTDEYKALKKEYEEAQEAPKRKAKRRLYIGLGITIFVIIAMPLPGIIIGLPILTTCAYYDLVSNEVIEPIDFDELAKIGFIKVVKKVGKKALKKSIAITKQIAKISGG